MKKAIIMLLFLICFVSNAQQNFINVPSCEVTEKNKLFFQQQLNFNELTQSNTTLDFGLGKGFEIGANVLGLNFIDKSKSLLNNDTNDHDPYNPLVMINGLKSFRLTENLSLAIGSQVGINFTDNKKEKEAGLLYENLCIKNLLLKNSCLVIGSYYNSMHYGGIGNRLGAWIGTEVPVNDHLHIMAESVLGSNALCYTSTGVVVYPVKWMPLTLGIQIPNTTSNAYSIVFELTIIPKTKKE